MPSSRLPLRRFWLPAGGSAALGAALFAVFGSGTLPAIGQSKAKTSSIAQAGGSIGVYSGRHYNTDKELYRQFTARTGIKVNVLEAKDDALLERLKSEGKNSPADVLVLVDAARLDAATDQGLFRPSRSAALQRDVPANLRDAQGRWFGLTRRVRAVVVNPKLVNPATIRTYADLAVGGQPHDPQR
jgi:iron(III) transport system substrate-binding protein